MISKYLGNNNKLLLFLILLLTITVYSPSLFITFYGDEPAFVLRNEVHSIEEWLNLLDKKEYDGAYYRPVGNIVSGTLTFIFGEHEWLYRLFNVLLHALNGIVFFLFARKILYNYKDNWLPSLIATIFFIIFPLHETAVIWHTDLFDRILFMLYLGTLVLYLEYRIFTAIFTGLLAFLTKEMAFSLPAIIFLTAYLPGKKSFKSSFRDATIFALLLIAVILFRYLVLNNHLFESDLTHPDSGISGVIKNLVFFTGLMFFPYDSYGIKELFSNNMPLFILGGLILAVATGIFFYKQRNFWKTNTYLVLFFLLSLSPAIRLLMKWYLYLPSVGIILLIVIMIFSIKNIKIRNLFITLLGLSYIFALIPIQFNWINHTKTNDQLLKSFSEQYSDEIKNNTLYFLTVPAKIGEYPVNHLNTAELFRYKLGINNEIEVMSRSAVTTWSDKIDCFSEGDNIRLMQQNSNYFVLYGYENILNYEPDDFYEGKLRRITIQKIPDETSVFMYSAKNYYKVK